MWQTSMKKHKFRQNEIIIQGDSHGLSWIRKALDRIPDGTDWFHVGDVGVGFQTYDMDWQTLETINNLCYQRGVRFFAVRGNHDSPGWWKNTQFSNLWLVPDYTEFEFPNGKTLLAVGGAFSIDRCMNIENVSWWKGELTPPLVGGTNGFYDYIISHDCPSFVNKPSASLKHFGGLPEKHRLAFGKDLIEEAEEQRQVMNGIFYSAQPKGWLYGHYHNDYKETKEGCDFRCFDINELDLFSA